MNGYQMGSTMCWYEYEKFKRLEFFSVNMCSICGMFLFVLMFCISNVAHATNSRNDEKRVALVIGNSAYRNVPILPNPGNDAEEVGNALKRLNFDVDFQANLTKPEMDKVLRKFGDRSSGAAVSLFYYAGHGLQVAGTNYLIPIDAVLGKERDLHYEAIDLSLVLREMEASQRINLIFLDACRDNPFSRKLTQGMDASRSVLIGRGLAPINANAGTLISYATKDGEVAEDGTDKHSPYTQALLNQIDQPGVEISKMLRKVRMEVIKITNKKQTPWEYGSLLGDFYFNGTTTIQLTDTVNPTANTNLEALYWQSIMNENTLEVFNHYLNKYPHGEFADLAKHKISILTKGSDTTSGASPKQQIVRSNPSDIDRSSYEVQNTPIPVTPISPTKKIVLVVPFENLSPIQKVVGVTKAIGLYENTNTAIIKVDEYSESSRSILEDIIASFPNVRIVERKYIDSFYIESSYPLINNKVVDPNFLSTAGKRLGANVIIAGSIVNIHESNTTFKGYGIQTRKKTCVATVRMRVIDIQSNQIIYSKTVEGKHDQVQTESGGVQNSDLSFLAIKNALGKFRDDKEIMSAF